MGLKIGMLTSGGDCQPLNAAMRGVAKTLYKMAPDTTIYGFRNGYKGLVEGNYRIMSREDFSGILTMGGTMLGTSRMPFKTINEPDEKGRNKVISMISTYKTLELDCLVMLGGNGSHKTAGLLKEKGLNVVTLPKTIDNDLAGTEMTFGFSSAVDIATRVIDDIHSTATSHSRVFIVELMGHKAGWLALHAGIAGGADIILLPEITYHVESLVKTIQGRIQDGKHFTIIAMAEGAMSDQELNLKKKDRKALLADPKYPSAAYRLCAELNKKFDGEIRIAIPGHIQRGGSPSPADRVLATRLGVEAGKLILNKEYGYMVCVKNNEIDKVPIEEVAGQTKIIGEKEKLIKQAEAMGISFGR